MQPRQRLADRDHAGSPHADPDRTNPLPIISGHASPRHANHDHANRDHANRDHANPLPAAPGRTDHGIPPARGDGVPAFHWSDLRPEVGARGAIAIMFMSSLLGDLAAQYLHAVRLTGFGVAIGCVAAACLTRRRALLVVATTPPLIFLLAITCAEALAAHADHVGLSAERIAVGVFLTLASTAPWLFGSFAVALVIAACRGLARRSG